MDSLIFYIFLGVIWLVQYIVKKKQEAERGQKPEGRESERNVFEEFKDLMEKGRIPDPFEEARQEIESRKAEPVDEQQIDETEIIEEETSEPEIKEPAPVQPLSKEFLIEKILNKYRPEAVLNEPQAETAPSYDFLDNLSNEMLEQGIILSTVLGPPKSARMMKRMNRCL